MTTPQDQTQISEGKLNLPGSAVSGEPADPKQPDMATAPAPSTTPLPEKPAEDSQVSKPDPAVAAAPASTSKTDLETPPLKKQRVTPSKLLTTAGEWSESIRKLLLNSIIAVLLILLVWTAYKELRQQTVVIDPIEVPADLSSRGHSSTAVALRLNDGIQEMLEGGASYFRSGEIAPLNLQPKTEMPDIDVPGGNVSLRTIIRYFRYAFDLPEPRVGGSISKEGDQLHLLLRQDKGLKKTLKAATLDELLLIGAEEVVATRNPLLAAGYFLQHPERDQDFKKAEAALNSELKKNANNAVVVYMLGEVFGKRNQLEAASEKYEQATRLDPHEPASFNNWGNVLSKMRDYTGSIEKYKRAAELTSDPSIPYRNWCASLISLKKLEEALEKCAHAVELRADYSAAYYVWGRALFDLQRYDEAIAKYQKATELSPQDVHVYREWGMALANLHRFDESIVKYRQATELDPNDAISFLGWGMALDQLKKYPEAIEKIKRSIEINPKYSEAYERWGYVLSLLGRHRESKSKYAQARQLKSK